MRELVTTLGLWAPFIWTGASAIGLGVSVRLSLMIRRTRTLGRAIHDEEGILLTLRFLFRLSVAFSLVFLSLIWVGLVAILTDGPLGALITLVILLALPFVLTWLAYRAIQLRVR